MSANLRIIHSNRWYKCNTQINDNSHLGRKFENVFHQENTKYQCFNIHYPFKFCTNSKYLKDNNTLIKDRFIITLHKLASGDTVHVGKKIPKYNVKQKQFHMKR